MALGKYDSRHHTVVCPVVDCNDRIFMDRGAYVAHMHESHAGQDAVYLDKGVRGSGGYDRSNAEDGGESEVFREEESLLKCGCDSTFFSLTSIQGHLVSSHGVMI